LEVDEGKENEHLSKQRTVCGDRECFNRDRYIGNTVGKACLQHYVSEEYEYVPNFKIHFKLYRVTIND
jgi:hypothetical protein